MTTADIGARQHQEVLDLHNEIMEKYLELLKRWEPTLPPEELPAMISTYDLANPGSIAGYKVLITTLLIDEVTDQRIVGLINLLTKTLREQGSDRG